MLSDDVVRYVELHRSLGYKFRAQACLLRLFTALAAGRAEDLVHTQTAIVWAAEAPSAAQRRERLQIVRRFALWIQAEDVRHEIPPADAFGKAQRRRRMPHIYSPAEIGRLLRAAGQLAPAGSIRPTTYQTLLALLAATGLRVSEALALRLDDLTPSGLLVRQTKFRKSRLVPLHLTAQHGLARYLALRQKIGGADDSLFVSLRGGGLSYSRFVGVFLSLMRSIGLRGSPGTRGPRIHDLRHTFAVRSLEACVGSDKDVARHVVALSTYLGHAHPSDTYWYLEATPRLMQTIAHSGEAFFEGVST
jgi:integrase